MYPIDTAKTRMQSCASLEAAIPFAQRSYRNTLQTLGKVVSEEGFPTLYRGLIPVLVGSAPEMAVQVAAYEWARDRIGQGKDKMDLSVHVRGPVRAPRPCGCARSARSGGRRACAWRGEE
jgi:hypothetical protein